MPRDTRHDIFGNWPKKSRTTPALAGAVSRWLEVGLGSVAVIAD